ncbi:MAG: aspartate aminotransferase family protein [Clostridiales bacterium]|nr:aspartate aminotransferase family protein [Clostridiales bacterium]
MIGYMEQAEKTLIHTYNRYNIILEKGDGVNLYDANGKKYLDFAAGIGVFALGYGNKEYNDGLKTQVDKLIHTSNLFYNEPIITASKKLVKASGMDRVFFTNSGTEAIEGAIKLARKYAYVKDKSTDHEIISMKHSFHGRSIGALSVTGNPKYQEAFKPLIPGIEFAIFNDLESVKTQITDKTCAIILEPIQGEGGVYPATKEFLVGVKRLCIEKDILLIFDEIQCGMGRTGDMFAWQYYGVKPDILTTAKALGGGVPVGAFLAIKEVAEAMVPGDHGSTYGGNPLVGAAVTKMFELYESNNVLENVKEIGEYLELRLDEIVEKYDVIKERRGKGLMQGLELTIPVSNIILNALDNGLIILSAGPNIIRFLPPLVITKSDVDEMIQKLERALA